MLPSKDETKLKGNKQRLKLKIKIKILAGVKTKNNQVTRLILNKNKQTSFHSHKKKALKQ